MWKVVQFEWPTRSADWIEDSFTRETRPVILLANLVRARSTLDAILSAHQLLLGSDWYPSRHQYPLRCHSSPEEPGQGKEESKGCRLASPVSARRTSGLASPNLVSLLLARVCLVRRRGGNGRGTCSIVVRVHQCTATREGRCVSKCVRVERREGSALTLRFHPMRLRNSFSSMFISIKLTPPTLA